MRAWGGVDELSERLGSSSHVQALKQQQEEEEEEEEEARRAQCSPPPSPCSHAWSLGPREAAPASSSRSTSSFPRPCTCLVVRFHAVVRRGS